MSHYLTTGAVRYVGRNCPPRGYDPDVKISLEELTDILLQATLGKRALGPDMEVTKYEETVTRGLFVEPAQTQDMVLPVPSYHLKPIVRNSKHISMVLVS